MLGFIGTLSRCHGEVISRSQQGQMSSKRLKVDYWTSSSNKSVWVFDHINIHKQINHVSGDSFAWEEIRSFRAKADHNSNTHWFSYVPCRLYVVITISRVERFNNFDVRRQCNKYNVNNNNCKNRPINWWASALIRRRTSCYYHIYWPESSWFANKYYS